MNNIEMSIKKIKNQRHLLYFKLCEAIKKLRFNYNVSFTKKV